VTSSKDGTAVPVEEFDTSVTVSVIVPSRNAAGTLAQQLAALSVQTDAHAQPHSGSWEVLVVDHGSTDGTADLARSWSDRLPIRVVQAPPGGGVSRARNVGIDHARGALLLFCDADDVVDARWVDEMVRALAHADLVGGNIVAFSTNPRAHEWTGWTPGERMGPALLEIGALASFRGANMAMRASAIGTLRFPEWYRWPGGEEVDFCWRAQIAGATLAAAPEAIVNYRLRSSRIGTVKQSFWWGLSVGRLYLDFPDLAQPRSKTAALEQWVVVLRDLVLIHRRRAWCTAPWRLATLAGRLAGALRFGSPAW